MNPNLHLLYLASGFVTGKVYHVINTTTGARVIGLGLLTARDIVAFLRNSTAQQGNPCAGTIERAYAFGASQSGRYLRQFLYLGLNEDEQERMVFDGLLVHIAGGNRGRSQATEGALPVAQVDHLGVVRLNEHAPAVRDGHLQPQPVGSDSSGRRS